MPKPVIAAVIVTWNPLQSDILECIKKLLSQVDIVIYSDNGSNTETKKLIVELEAEHKKISCIWNGINLGIATALNNGVSYAKKMGANWILTLDHDSVPEDGMIFKMLDAYERLGQEEKNATAIVCPNFMLAKGIAYPDSAPRLIETSITSGQLVKMDLFEKIGGYEDKLFIECVDHEFCFHARKEGYKILLVPNAIIKQRIGNPSVKKIFGRTFTVPHYSPERYYYQLRNTIFIYKKYLKTELPWIIKNIRSTIYSLGKVVFYENAPFKKIKFAAWGIFDGMRGKFGEFKNR